MRVRYGKAVYLIAASVLAIVLLFAGCQQPVNTAPSVEIKSVSPETVVEGQKLSVTFVAKDAEDKSLMYEVTVGEKVAKGTVESGKEETVEIEAPEVESTRKFTVMVTVKDSQGSAGADSKEVTVADNPPAEFSEFAIYAKDGTWEKLEGNVVNFGLEDTRKVLKISFVVVDKLYDDVPSTGKVAYKIYFGDELIGEGEAENNSTVESSEVILDRDEVKSGRVEVKIILDDGHEVAEYTVPVVINIEGGLFVKAKTNVIGAKETSMDVEITYVASGVAADKFVLTVKDYSSGEKIWSKEYSPAELFGYEGNNTTITVGDGKDIDTSKFETGKYLLEVAAYEVSPVSSNLIAVNSLEFYYYSLPEGFEDSFSVLKVSTNIDVEDLYRGDASSTFTLKISKAASILIPKDEFLSLYLFSGKDSWALELEGAPSIEASEVKDLGKYNLVVAPATITVTVKELLPDSTELADAYATAVLMLADGALIKAEKEIGAVDAHKPTFTVLKVNSYENDSITIEYNLVEANLKEGTIVFYVYDEAGKPATVATVSIESGYHKDLRYKLTGHFDKTKVYYDYEVWDKAGHYDKVSGKESSAEVDNAVGKVEVEWKDIETTKDATYYYNASTSLVLKITVVDESGVNAGDVSVILPDKDGIEEDESTVVNYSYSEDGKTLEYYYMIAFASPAEVMIGASDITIKVSDKLGNSWILNYNNSKLGFPRFEKSATVVYDTKAPDVSNIEIDYTGRVFGLGKDADTYFASAVIIAELGGSSKTVKEVTLKDLDDGMYELTDKDFESVFGFAPNSTDATFDVIVMDFAGNESSKTNIKVEKLDVVKPTCVSSSADTEITLASSYAEFYVKADSGSTIVSVTISGVDVDKAYVKINDGDWTTNSENEKPWTISLEATEATILVSFENNAELSQATTMKISVAAQDNTYKGVVIYENVIDYSKIFPSIKPLYAIEGNNGQYLVFELESWMSTYTVSEVAGAVTTIGKWGEGVYVIKDDTTDDNSTITVDPGKAATFTAEAGAFSVKVEWSDSLSWTVKNYEEWTLPIDAENALEPDDYFFDTAFLKERVSYGKDYVMEVAEGEYYWYLSKDSTMIVFTLPVKEGLVWMLNGDGADESGIFHVDFEYDTSNATLVEATVTYDNGGTFNSEKYMNFLKVKMVNSVNVAAGLEGFTGDENKPIPLFGYYANGLMDYYKVTIVASAATAIEEDTSNSADDPDLIEVYLKFKTKGKVAINDAAWLNTIRITLFKAQDSDDTAVTTYEPINTDATIVMIETDGDYYTYEATLTFKGDSNNDDAADFSLADDTNSEKTIQNFTIPNDAFLVKFKPNGFTNGFWLTNFEGDWVINKTE